MRVVSVLDAVGSGPSSLPSQESAVLWQQGSGAVVPGICHPTTFSGIFVSLDCFP